MFMANSKHREQIRIFFFISMPKFFFFEQEEKKEKNSFNFLFYK